MKTKLIALGALVASATSQAAVDTSTIWSEIDLSGVATNVVAVGVVAVGIAVALKAISLAKRAVSKA